MNKVVKGIVWKVLQQYGSFFIKLVIQIVLARILLPEQFGLVAKVLVIVVIAETIANSGLGIALVQKVDSDYQDYSTALIGSMIFSVILYIFIFFAAPTIARFYEDLSIIKILRIYGIAIFLTSFISIQNAYIVKNYRLRSGFVASLYASIISGGISILLAVSGFGVWAIVIQSLMYLVVYLIILQLFIDWKPRADFSIKRFRKLFSVSWKVLISSILGTMLENIYNLSIGKLYGNELLAYYNRGILFPSIIIGQLSSSINTLTLPWYAESQNNKENLVKSIRKVNHLAALLIFPIATGIACISNSLIRILLTEKWLPSLFFLRLECLFYGSLVISTSIGNAMIAIGRTDIGILLEGLKLVALITCIFFLSGFGINILCIARLFVALGIIFLSIAIAKRLFGYTFYNVVQDIFKPLLLCIVMGLMVIMASRISINEFLSLLLQIVVGIFVYLVGVFVFMKDDVYTLKNLLLQKRK